MDILSLAIGAFAVYRTSIMVAEEAGPFKVFERLRGWAINHFGKNHWVVDGLTCPYCLSFWLAFPAALFILAGYTVLLIPLALSGAAVLLVKLYG